MLCCCTNPKDDVVEKKEANQMQVLAKEGITRAPAPRLVREEVAVPVSLNVYSLVDGNKKLVKMGMGIFHTGVVVYGIEWGYGEVVDNPNSSGLFSVHPGQAAGTLYRTLKIGHTTKSPMQVDTILHRLENEWRSRDYHILHHNCNHFAKRLCDLLSTTEKLRVPDWCNRAARVGDRVIPKKLATKVQRMMDDDPPKAMPPPAPKSISEMPNSVIPRQWYLHPRIVQPLRYTMNEAAAAAAAGASSAVRVSPPSAPRARTATDNASSGSSSSSVIDNDDGIRVYGTGSSPTAGEASPLEAMENPVDYLYRQYGVNPNPKPLHAEYTVAQVKPLSATEVQARVSSEDVRGRQGRKKKEQSSFPETAVEHVPPEHPIPEPVSVFPESVSAAGPRGRDMLEPVDEDDYLEDDSEIRAAVIPSPARGSKAAASESEAVPEEADDDVAGASVEEAAEGAAHAVGAVVSLTPLPEEPFTFHASGEGRVGSSSCPPEMPLQESGGDSAAVTPLRAGRGNSLPGAQLPPTPQRQSREGSLADHVGVLPLHLLHARQNERSRSRPATPGVETHQFSLFAQETQEPYAGSGWAAARSTSAYSRGSRGSRDSAPYYYYYTPQLAPGNAPRAVRTTPLAVGDWQAPFTTGDAGPAQAPSQEAQTGTTAPPRPFSETAALEAMVTGGAAAQPTSRLRGQSLMSLYSSPDGTSGVFSPKEGP